MPIKYQPRAGAVVRCDFHGMIEPEMVKMRDVVVFTRHPHNPKLVTVVPLSTSQPIRVEAYHYPLKNDPRPEGDSMRTIWAKCDMIYTVSLERLATFYRRSRRGGRELVNVMLPVEEFAEIRRCVAIALELANNEGVPLWGFESDSASA
ncbi:hypothetical protein AGMMS49545_04920 [Betaproteobacteria bacterium]|nr:hypothetical protein AGMMS49545_04920 [Betaproteobacteria bacterium]GHU41092.1 hypothetical protein AGMMS50289_03680 [Betaproteobacteria bacterium]